LKADITDPASLAALPKSLDWVVHCVSASRAGPGAYERVYLAGTRNLLNRLAGAVGAKLVYTSSTSVYGQNDGSWVTEESDTAPTAPAGVTLLETEQLVLEASRNGIVPGLVLRLAGIYGPGRDYWRRLFLESNGQLDGEGHRFLNMIHRDDVMGAVLAALEHGAVGEVYNVVDNEPVSQRDLFRWLSEKLGRSAPQPGPPRDAARKRGVTSKRISNQKLRMQLGYRLKYPTFRDGYTTL
jgi:nucleoside-diphosphate-sugar epimerase